HNTSIIYQHLDVLDGATVTVLGAASIPSGGTGIEEAEAYVNYAWPYSGLGVYGGGTIDGTIDTSAGVGTGFSGAAYTLGTTGKLEGEGWYAVSDATLSLGDDEVTVNRLFAGFGSLIQGSADLTVTKVFVAQGATFEGPDTSKVVAVEAAYT